MPVQSLTVGWILRFVVHYWFRTMNFGCVPACWVLPEPGAKHQVPQRFQVYFFSVLYYDHLPFNIVISTNIAPIKQLNPPNSKIISCFPNELYQSPKLLAQSMNPLISMSSTTHEEWADEEITTCATCRRDGARRCVGCNGAPDNEGRQLYPTYYCSTQCQKTDYIRTHKHACKAAKDRRAVYRVGDIAQLAFYAYSERLFDTSITKVEKKDDTLYLRQGKNDQNLLLPFPSKLFSNKDEKSAALTALAHDNAIGFVHILIEKMVGSAYRPCPILAPF